MITAPQNQTALESKETEMIVLGCMLSNQKNLEIAVDQLDENDFFSNEHKLIFSALKRLHLKGKSADVHLVSQELKYIEKLHVCGGIPYITEVAHYAGTSANLLDYIDILKEKSLSKGVLDLGIEMQKAVLNHPGS
ncbi:MAG: replicative DNA helicase, partial [Chlamydiae bacterium]|nr:replicative DNA helicase [Chlamydiota bacterium]